MKISPFFPVCPTHQRSLATPTQPVAPLRRHCTRSPLVCGSMTVQRDALSLILPCNGPFSIARYPREARVVADLTEFLDARHVSITTYLQSRATQFFLKYPANIPGVAVDSSSSFAVLLCRTCRFLCRRLHATSTTVHTWVMSIAYWDIVLCHDTRCVRPTTITMHTTVDQKYPGLRR